MGWWGHGIMDGDGPSDAAYTIKMNAVAKVFGNEEDVREFVDEYEDLGFNSERTQEDEDVMKAFVHENLDAIVKGAMKDARADWNYGGGANLIAAAYTLVKEYGVKRLPKTMKPLLVRAFEVEHEDASDFDSARARRSALRTGQRIINRALGR